MSIERASVRVPGTTANLGPGFDCLGIALAIHNELTVERATPQPQETIIAQAAELFFQKSGIPAFGYRWSIAGSVPRSRGLGSSVTVRLGLLQGLNELCERPLQRDELFALCAALEGHPDNAAPAVFGGFTVARANGQVARFPIDERVKFILLIPNFEMETAAARKVMPAQLSLPDAVFSLGNACAITAAFAGGDYASLRGTFADRIHQPWRAPLIPILPAVIAAAESSGALGGFLSGSGSTIAAIALENAEAIARAMAEAAGEADVRIVSADNQGALTLPIDR